MKFCTSVGTFRNGGDIWRFGQKLVQTSASLSHGRLRFSCDTGIIYAWAYLSTHDVALSIELRCPPTLFAIEALALRLADATADTLKISERSISITRNCSTGTQNQQNDRPGKNLLVEGKHYS